MSQSQIIDPLGGFNVNSLIVDHDLDLDLDLACVFFLFFFHLPVLSSDVALL